MPKKKNTYKNILKSTLPIRGNEWITLTQYATLQGCAYATAYAQAKKGRFPIRLMKENGKKNIMKVVKAEVDQYWVPEVMETSRPDRKSARKCRQAPEDDFRDEDGAAVMPALLRGQGPTNILQDDMQGDTKISTEDIFKDATPAIVKARAAAEKEFFLAKKEKANYEKVINALVDYELFTTELEDVFVLLRESLLAIPDRMEKDLGAENAKAVEQEIKDSLRNLSSGDFIRKIDKSIGK